MHAGCEGLLGMHRSLVLSGQRQHVGYARDVRRWRPRRLQRRRRRHGSEDVDVLQLHHRGVTCERGRAGGSRAGALNQCARLFQARHLGLMAAEGLRGTPTCTGALRQRGRPSKTCYRCFLCSGSMLTRAMLCRVYVVPALPYAVPETTGLTDQQLQPLISAHNAYLRRFTGMGVRSDVTLYWTTQMCAAAGLPLRAGGPAWRGRQPPRGGIERWQVCAGFSHPGCGVGLVWGGSGPCAMACPF
eukprot:364387-Chlamydomonas_euryale.AAC.6